MALTTYALTTLARFKTFAGITVADDDALLLSIINVVTDFVEKYCDRRFIKTTYTQELYDGSGLKTLVLNQFPVVSTETFLLEQRTSVQNINSFSSLESNSYYIKYTKGILELTGGRFSEIPQYFRVTYTAGYAFKNDVAPLVTLEEVGIADLELAVWKLVNYIFLKRKSAEDIQSEKLGDYQISYNSSSDMKGFIDENPEVKEILGLYCKINLI